MTGPWERFQQAQQDEEGPWARFRIREEARQTPASPSEPAQGSNAPRVETSPTDRPERRPKARPVQRPSRLEDDQAAPPPGRRPVPRPSQEDAQGFGAALGERPPAPVTTDDARAARSFGAALGERAPNVDTTDDARAARGFGRSAYMDGLQDPGRGGISLPNLRNPEQERLAESSAQQHDAMQGRAEAAEAQANADRAEARAEERRQIEVAQAEAVEAASIDGNPDGVAAWRAIQRGGLRTAATLPYMEATSAWSAIQDSRRSEAELARDTFLTVTGLESIPQGVTVNSAESASSAITQLGFAADRVTMFRDVLEVRAQNAEQARQNPQRYVREFLEARELGQSLMDRANALPMSPAAERMRVRLGEDESAGGTIASLVSNPMEAAAFLGEVGFESAPQIAASAAASVATRNPAAGAAVMGLGSVAQEYGASVQEFLDENGVRIETEEDAIALLNDPNLMREASRRGITRGLVIAIFEAAGQGVGARALMDSPIGDAIAQTLVQGATGAGGEATARAAAGQEWSAQEVIIEGLAELVTAPAEVAGAATARTPSPETPEGPPPADDPERLNSPRLTDSDRASPIPNDALDDGFAALEEIEAGVPPDQQTAGLGASIAPQPWQMTPPEPSQPFEGAIAPPVMVGRPGQDEAPNRAAPDRPAEPGYSPVMPEVDASGNETGRNVRVNYATGQAEVVEGQQPAAPPASTPAPQQEEPNAPQAPQAPEPAQAEPDEVAAPSGVATGPDARQIEVLTNENLGNVATDAETFQYKGGADAQGVTDRLRDVSRWDNNRTGMGLIYEYSDGRRVIVDGHQRFGLAQRLAALGQEVNLPVRVLRQIEGVTESDARAIGAEKNIAEGSGSALDAARVFRETRRTASELDLPMSSAMVRTADGLAGLSDTAFGMVNNNVASERDGALVGALVENQRQHESILALLSKLNPANATQAESIIRQAMDTEVRETQTSLFGEEEVSANLYLERAKVLDAAIKQLGRDVQTFRTLVERGETIVGEGNVLQGDANEARLTADAQARAALSKQANTKGPISDALTEAARQYRDGGKLAAAARAFIERARNPESVAPADGAGSRGSRAGDGSAQAARPGPDVAETQNPEVARDAPQGGRTVPAGDLFDQGPDSQPGERQTDLEDLIAEANERDSTGAGGTRDGRNAAANPEAKPTYIFRQVLNADDIRAWAATQGFKSTLPADELHVTQVYAKEPVDRSQPAMEARKGKVTSTGGRRSVETLGDEGAVVLRFQDAGLAQRWDDLQSAGAMSDFDSYKAHITITYDASGVDLDTVEPYRGPIELGPEQVEDITGDFDPSSIKEEPLEAQRQEAIDAAPVNSDVNNSRSKRKAKSESPAPAKRPVLNDSERTKLDGLLAQMSDKFRNQLNAGLDPEMVSLAVQAADIYVKAGVRRFRDFVLNLAEGLGLPVSKVGRYARIAYNDVRDEMEANGEGVADMDDSRAVIAELARLNLEEKENASGTGTDLEQDRGRATASDGMGTADVPAAGRADGEGTGARGSQTREGRGGQREDGSRVSEGDAAGVGSRRDQAGRDAARAEPGPANDRDSTGGRDRREQGLPADEGRAEDSSRHASDGADLSDRKAAQARADKIAVRPADEANIRETLPLLLPEQQDDVLKIERRFAKPDGFGMLLTNGTGTGKTYSGGGAIKRFVQQGKDNILILAPSQGILDAWVGMGADLGIPISKLDSTQDAGTGVVATTYANAGENNKLAERDWDLIVTDEAQKLSQNAAGGETAALRAVRAVSNRPQDLFSRAKMMLADKWAKVEAIPDGEAKTAQKRAVWDETKALAEKLKSRPRSNVLFLSATPFAYDKNIDYAEGYLFNYPGDGVTDSGSRQSGQNLFMVENFGYRIRYHKLTKPEAAVDSGVFEREFHEKLRREGVLSGRSLDIEADYDRRFVAVDSEIGENIDRALKYLSDQRGDGNDERAGWDAVNKYVRRNFTYLKRLQLLEAVKGQKAIPDIRRHLDMGRKVVVFHDYNVGGGTNPFAAPIGEGEPGYQQFQQFIADNPYVRDMDFSAFPPPAQALLAEFGDRARLYNGTVSNKDRAAAKTAFNTDGSGVDLFIVQSAAGEAGISLHDTTGGHQRALINLGMPTRPTTTLQEEGRIRRVGSVSDALFRYYTIGTAWEREAFASKIAERSGTVENLALGNEARAIRESFIEAYTEADRYEPGMDGEGKGGKDRDRSVALTTPYEQAKTHYFGRQKNTRSRNARQGLDFYATPEPLGFQMAAWAQIRQYEKVLEPSAGDGAIARYFPQDADRTIVEPSFDLSTRAQIRAPGARAVTSTFEEHHINNKYDAVVMNPPFGSGGKMAYEHVAKAMRHVRPGGRIVALVPTGPAADKRLPGLFEEDNVKPGEWHFTADVRLPAVAFEKAGTRVMSRVLILDRMMEAVETPTQRINITGPETIGEFFDRLEGIAVPDRPAPLVEAGAIAEMDDAHAADQSALTAIVENPGGSFETFEFDHSRTGEQQFGASARDRMSRETYLAVSAAAKRFGGYYSKYQNRASGAKRGFLFTSEEDRAAFIEEMEKPIAIREQRALTQEGTETMFYSPLLRAVQNAKQRKAPAKDWQAILAKLPGVKQAEIEWLGVYDWLDSQEGAQVPREVLEQFIRDGQIELVESRLEFPEDLDDLDGMDAADAPQFETYTESGGTDYREILLRVPNLHETGRNKPPSDAEITDALAGASTAGKRPFVQSSHFEQENIVVHARVKDRAGAEGERVLFVEEIQSDLASKWRESTESPEVTARRRELEAEDHQAYLAYEQARDEALVEIQNVIRTVLGDDESSVAQGLDRMDMNFALSGGEGGTARMISQLANANPTPRYEAAQQAFQRRSEIRVDLLNLGTERRMDPSTPDTPFKEEHTYTLMVKRLLREAAEKGYDRLSWTPGYMQAERWNAAAQSVVEEVEWSAPDAASVQSAQEGSGTDLSGYRYVNLTMADGGRVIDMTVDPTGKVEGTAFEQFSGKQLSQIVGPQVAKQVMTENTGTVSGQKITFPDSGYAIAYDQQTRKAVEKFAKKYGGRVYQDRTLPDMRGQPDIDKRRMAESGEITGDEALQRLTDAGLTPDMTVDRQMDIERSWGRGNLQEDPAKVLIALRTADSAGKMSIFEDVFPDATGERLPVWSIDITPELRAAALEPMPILQEAAIETPDASLMDDGTLREILPELRKALDDMGLKRVRLGIGQDRTRQGVFQINRIGAMDILIGASLNLRATLYHESIHALRALNAFSDAEWSRLEAAARDGWMTKHRIAERYPDLSEEQQIEEAIAEEFGEWAANGQADNGGIRLTFEKIRRIMQAIASALTGRGFFTAEDVFGRAISGELMRRHAGNTGALRSEGSVERAQTKEDRFAAQVLSELSDLDDIFANPTSTAITIEGVFSDIMPDARYIGETQTPEETAEAGADERHLLRTPGGNDFVIYQDEDRVWIDVSRMKEGEGGNRVYSAISDYAINTGRTFIGDPAGLSAEALRRRTENMLSSALKHGTTEHLEPHEYQTRGDESLGVPPLRWKSGDHLGNIQRMIDVVTESVTHHIPEIRRARYDFQTGTFRTSQGERISDGMLRTWSESGRMRTAGIGGRTAKRSILLHTLSRTESGERPGLLEQVFRQQRQRLSRGLDGIFYQRMPVLPDVGPELSQPLPDDGFAAGGLIEFETTPEARDQAASLARDMRSELRKLGLPNIKTRGVERLFAEMGEIEKQELDGLYFRGIITAALSSGRDWRQTVRHEAIHALRDPRMWGKETGLFRPAEWRALERYAKTQTEALDRVRALYRGEPESIILEEVIADLFADFMDGRFEPTGFVAAGMRAIRNALEAIGNAMRGNGFSTAEAVFRRVGEGEVGRRQFDGRQRPEPPLTASDRPRDRNGRFVSRQAMTQGDLRPMFAVRRLSRQGRVAVAQRTNTAHIPDRKLWEELAAANVNAMSRAAGGKGAVGDWIDRRRIGIQDRMLPLLRAEQAIERLTGTEINRADSAYYAEERYTGRVGRRLDQIDERYTKPIITLIAKAEQPIEIMDQNGETRTGADAVSLWLMARHAKERNARIAQINPRKPDGGSGLLNAQADAILAQAGASPNAQRLERIGKLIDRLGRQMIDLREGAGLLTTAEAATWRSQYKHYVPLLGFAETDMYDAIVNEFGTATGRRYNVRGSESKMALGRGSEAFDPLTAMLTQAQEVAIRAEKNLVAQTFYRLIKAYPNKAMWEVKSPQVKQFYNRDSGQVETRVVDPVSMVMRPNEMALKLGGIEHRILLNDPRLERAMGQLGSNEMSGFIRAMSMFSRYFSSVNTMLSPPFIIVNAFRDMITAQVNLGGFAGKDAKAIRKAALRDWIKAARGANRGMKGRIDTEWSRYFREFEQAGGKVSFWRIEDHQAGQQDLRRRVKRAARGRVAGTLSSLALPSTRDNPALEWIERVNLSVDNAVRLAAFVEARKQGWSAEDAASLSKNLTVNFNRRGEYGPAMNALWPFANAAVQGTQVMLRAMSHRKVKYTVAGMVLFGLVNDILNAALSGEDDDGELEYDQIPSYVTERNLVFPNPFGGDESFITIPLPYGFNTFFFAGQQIGKMLRGVKPASEAVPEMAMATFSAFSPLSGESSFQIAMPTLVDHMAELAMNRDWLGRPIRPEPAYADYGPQSYREYNVSGVSRSISRGLNSITGGSSLEPGMIDVSPEYLEHTFGFLTGGAGRFVGRVSNAVEMAAQGRASEIEAYQIPLLRVLRYESGDWLNRNRYYEFRNVVNEAHWAVRQSEETGAAVPARLLAADSLYSDLRNAERARRGNQDALDAIYGDDSLSSGELSRTLEPVQNRMNSVFVEFNRRFIEVMGPQAE